MVYDILLLIILLVSMAVLTVAFRTLRSSQRSEKIGESRYELLREQRERLTFLDEERRALREELERESEKRQQLMKYLEGGDTLLTQKLEQNEHLEAQRELEHLEKQRFQPEQEQRALMKKDWDRSNKLSIWQYSPRSLSSRIVLSAMMLLSIIVLGIIALSGRRS